MKASVFRTLVLLLASLMATRAHAVSGTWNTNPMNGDWNVSANWSSLAVPNGPADIASFGASSITSVFLSASTQVDSVIFNPGASAYTITSSPTRTLTLSGAGILNHSGSAQTLVAGVDASGAAGTITFSNEASVDSSVRLISSGSSVANRAGGVVQFLNRSSAGDGLLVANGGTAFAASGARIRFFDAATAGAATVTLNPGAATGASAPLVEFFGNSSAGRAVFTNNGAVFGELFDSGGGIAFYGQATAAKSTITNNGGNVSGAGGSGTAFYGNSSAGTASITNNGGTASQSFGGATGFGDNATAGDSMIVNNGALVTGGTGGRTSFTLDSTAGASTLIANGGPAPGTFSGGEIAFEGRSSGGTARVVIFGNAFLNIRQHTAGGTTIGSLEGTGRVFLGNNNLSIGSNDLSTEFSGVIRFGGPFGPDPTGGSITKVGAGTLVLSGQSTYTGLTTVNAGNLIINGAVQTPVLVNGGALGGTGTTGAVTVSSGATLSPGDGPGILHVQGHLRLSLGATYLIDLNGATVGTQSDQITVAGTVTLDTPTLVLSLGSQAVAGAAFTIIENDGSDLVEGIFASLGEGAIFVADGQSFRISYRGGSGNDVVLTAVVPEPATWALAVTGGLFMAASRYSSSSSSAFPPARPTGALAARVAPELSRGPALAETTLRLT